MACWRCLSFEHDGYSVLETYEGVVRALRFPYDTYFCWFEEEDEEEEEEEESNCTIYIIRCRPNA